MNGAAPPKARKPRARNRKHPQRITDEVLRKVAQAYVDAEPGGKTAAVAAAAGCNPKSSAYYISRAKQAGYLE